MQYLVYGIHGAVQLNHILYLLLYYNIGYYILQLGENKVSAQ